MRGDMGGEVSVDQGSSPCGEASHRIAYSREVLQEIWPPKLPADCLDGTNGT